MKLNIKKGIAILIVPILMCLSLPLIHIYAKNDEEASDLVSPALYVLAEQNSMAMAGMTGNAIKFDADDFARAMNLSEVEQITITEIPPATDGELRVGSTVLGKGQTVSRSSISLMSYTPSSDISTSEFRFRIGDTPYDICCKLYMLDEMNYSPTLSYAPKTALEVSTHENVMLFGTLPCYDPDGDATVIEIVSYPEKGVIHLTDRAAGEYRYIPTENATGKDSFTYVARDIYGNYSASATVSLDITKQSTSVVYVDLVDSPYHNAALTMTEKGIMNGTDIGTATYFYPSKTVSRAEFTVMAMNAAGITEVNQVGSTVFADDGEIESGMKGYISAAYELGYINGTEKDGKLCFEPDREITRAEAAVMLSNILDAAAPTVKPVFEDSEDIPAWAESSVNAMSALGVLSAPAGSANSISPLSAVTRGDAARMLESMIALKK